MTAWPRSQSAWLAMLLIALAGLRCAANAETLEVTGYVGVLGEWELTVRVTTDPAEARNTPER